MYYTAVTNKYNDIDAIRLGIASPDMIREWSYGEVTKPITTGKNKLPEGSPKNKKYSDENGYANGGVFCEKIFGPVKDYECACGKYKDIKYAGKICELCGVEVTSRNVRRERMGHIELATPIVNFMFLRTGYISRLLDMSQKCIVDITYYDAYVVLESSIKEIVPKSVMSYELYAKLADEYGIDTFRVGTGGSAIKELLSQIDITKEIDKLKSDLTFTKDKKNRSKILKRLEVFEAFSTSGNKPEWMVFDVLPVMPADLRPMMTLENGRTANHELNEFYVRIVSRNNKVKSLISNNAPEQIKNYEKKILQKAVDGLIHNEKCDPTRKILKTNSRTNKTEYKSIIGSISGKKGQMRGKLLGKRVDYSGRSIIVVGPELKLNQCGLPKDMAIELFKPFVISRLVKKEIASSISEAKKMIERKDEVIWNILSDVIKDKWVILNRQPTLHKLGMVAFQPILIDTKAIRLHPLMCAGYNADFDGDQMAVYLSLSDEAQKECRELLQANNNLLKPSDGKVTTIPSQDMVLGIYYLSMCQHRRYQDCKPTKKYCQAQTAKNIKNLTQDLMNGTINKDAYIKIKVTEENGQVNEIISKPIDIIGRRYKDITDANIDYDNKVITLQQPIYVEHTAEYNGQTVTKYVKTTLGRLILNGIIPQDIGFVDRTNIENVCEPEINKLVTKKEINKIINAIMEKHGKYVQEKFLDNIKELGYKYSTLSGITVSIEDMTMPSEKNKTIDETKKLINYITGIYKKGHITDEERYNTIITLWSKTDKEVTDLLMKSFNKENNIYIMADSGARGSEQQIKQLVGMRGLMADTSGKVLEQPVKACFREGLTLLEYFMSSHGARKGMSDTALKTANAGYLTRRLIYAAQDVIISYDDCADNDSQIPGMLISPIMEGKEKIESLQERITGRIAAEDICDANGNIIIPKNELITKEKAEEIVKTGIDHNKNKIWDKKNDCENPNAELLIRNVLTCKAPIGICAKCYGINNATAKMAKQGEPSGIIASQSIGEPGTQLTLRTFHTGGVASDDDITQGLPRVEELLEARTPKGRAEMAEISGRVRIKRNNKNDIVTIINDENQYKKTYNIPFKTKLKVKENDYVHKGDQLTEGACDLKEMLELNGVEKTEKYILKEVHKVYRMQGVDIVDVHFEVFIRKMLQNIMITDPGDSGYNEETIMTIGNFEMINYYLEKDSKKPMTGQRLIRGIHAIAKNPESFLASVGFEEPGTSLAKAAIFGSTDPLNGIMENTIMGRKLPIGTGYMKQ